jgi:hypothetical protein
MSSLRNGMLSNCLFGTDRAPATSNHFCFLRLSESYSLSRIQFASICVQNFPNSIAELGRNSPSVLANYVSVDSLRDVRASSVTESLLTQSVR